MSEAIVVFNAGSTSLKFGAYELGAPQGTGDGPEVAQTYALPRNVPDAGV